MRNEQGLSLAADLSRRQAELYPILERQARLYTMGESGSVPDTTAQELLRSVCFCIETHLALAGGSLEGRPLEEVFEAGQRDIWRLTEEVQALHRRAAGLDPGYGSIALRDTMASLARFRPDYDLRFFAHSIPSMIDYPLCLPVSEALEGVRFVADYLERLILEHRFCASFPRADALAVLEIHEPEFAQLVLNLADPLLACALGLALLGRDPVSLRLHREDCPRLYELFRPWDPERAEALLRQAAGALCARFAFWDTAMRAYLREAARGLIPLLRTTSFEGYGNIFCPRKRG